MRVWRFLPHCSLVLVVLLGISFAAAQTWTQYGTPSRFSHSAFFDPNTKKMIVFGGQNSATKSNLNDLWQVSTSAVKFVSETQISASGSLPKARYGHAAIYDSSTNRMTIFGGATGFPSPCLNDVWLLSNANGQLGTPTWSTTSPSGATPTARYRHTAVYDQTTNSMIVFGGSNCSKGYFNDVWVLSDANGGTGTPNWTQLHPAGTAPTAREASSAVYDSANNLLIIYGGDAGSTNFGDVWVLSNANGSGGTPVWTQLSPLGAAPYTRTGHSAVYDATNNRMIIFGGFHTGRTLNDTYVLTFANGIGGTPTWNKVTATGTAPAVGYHSAVYDPAQNAMFVFAGSSSNAKLAGDDHAFTLTNANGIGASSWTRGGPPARFGQSIIYDSSTDSAFVFAGQHALTNTNFGDYWQATNVTTSNDLSWTPVNAGGTHPKNRSGQAVQYDSVNKRMMVFGGANGFPAPCLNDYAVLTGANNVKGRKPSWISVVPTGTAPAVRMQHSSAYDAASNTLIIFGGFDCQSTYYNDVWVLSSANVIGSTPAWTHLAPQGTAPDPRESASAIYNSTTNTLTVFGGDAGGAPFGDIWVLSFANGIGGTPAWTEITPSNNGPSARSGHTATYDAQNDVMTIYGGYDGTKLLGDAWVLSAASGQGISTWTQIPASGAAPARRFASAVYDSVSNQVMVFGGVFNLPSLPDDHMFSLTHANGLP